MNKIAIIVYATREITSAITVENYYVTVNTDSTNVQSPTVPTRH